VQRRQRLDSVGQAAPDNTGWRSDPRRVNDPFVDQEGSPGVHAQGALHVATLDVDAVLGAGPALREPAFRRQPGGLSLRPNPIAKRWMRVRNAQAIRHNIQANPLPRQRDSF
jgi:hypothetical protein